jgi:hypothetical protein
MPTVPYVRATHSDGQSWSAAKANQLEAGINDLSYAPCVRVSHNAAQSIPNNVQTTLTFNSERFDQAGNAGDTMHESVTNPSRLTCRYAGVYQISASVAFAGNATGARSLGIFHSAAAGFVAYQQQPSVSADVIEMTISTLWLMAVNDYVVMSVFQNSGGALNVNATPYHSPEFMMVRVG